MTYRTPFEASSNPGDPTAGARLDANVGLFDSTMVASTAGVDVSLIDGKIIVASAGMEAVVKSVELFDDESGPSLPALPEITDKSPSGFGRLRMVTKERRRMRMVIPTPSLVLKSDSL